MMTTSRYVVDVQIWRKLQQGFMVEADISNEDIFRFPSFWPVCSTFRVSCALRLPSSDAGQAIPPS
jgi:hypothetical protein